MILRIGDISCESLGDFTGQLGETYKLYHAVKRNKVMLIVKSTGFYHLTMVSLDEAISTIQIAPVEEARQRYVELCMDEAI